MPGLFRICLLFCAFALPPTSRSSFAPPLPTTGSGIGVTFLRMPELVKNQGGKNIPLDAEVVFKNLSRYDAVWLSQDITWNNRPAWNLLQKKSPGKLMLGYVCSLSSQPRTSFEYVFDYDYINTYHPEWFLVKDTKDPLKADPRNPDNRIRWAPSDKNSYSYNRFYLDIGNKEFQDWAVQRLLKYVSGKAGEFDYTLWKNRNLDYSYDGIAFDNVVFRSIRVRFNKPYPNWKYADDIDGWKNAFLTYLGKVHKALAANGYLLVVNFSFYWELTREESDLYDLADTVDGIMHEWAIGYGTDGAGRVNRHWSGETWLRYIERHEAILKRDLIDWWACYPSTDPNLGREQFMYAYCSFLLVKRPGYSLFYASSDKGLHRNDKVPWYGEYDLPIGQPLSERYLKDNCWFRDYTNARIVVNPAEVSRKIALDRDKQWLEERSKEALTELTLPPKSGRILLPVSSGADVQNSGIKK